MRIKILFLLLGFLTQTYSQTTYTLADVPADLLKGTNSVLLDEKIEIDVTQLGKQVISKYQVQLVLNKKGKNNVRTHEFYDKDTKIDKIEIYVYDVFGNEIDHFKKRNFKDVSAVSNGSIYTDDRVLYLNYIPTTYPYIVIFKSIVKNNTTAFISDWNPVKGFSRSTWKSSYRIKFDPTNKPKLFTKNLEGYTISISENPNEFICEVSNIKSIKYEEYSPHKSKILPSISFALHRFSLKGVQGYAENWQEFGSWMQSNLMHDVSDLPESTILEIKNLVHNETNNIKKARIVYNYLQEKVRYISVQIDIGGWKPMLASDVDKLSYGDCKALTNYTKAILDVLEIPSYYTVLFAGDNEIDITKEFTGMQGNHAILGIQDDDEIVWLECTSQDTPFGYLGNFTDDRDVLIFTKEGGKVVHTKVYDYTGNTQDTQATLNINSNGYVTSNYVRTYKGLQYDRKYVLERKSNEDLKKHYLDKWGYINGYVLKNIEINDNKEDIIFTEKLEMDIPNYCSTIGEDLLFCPNVFNQIQNVPPRINNRKQKLYISSGFIDNDSIVIKLPNNYMVDVLPENISIENKFGSYTIRFKNIDDTKFEYYRQFILKKGDFPPEEYMNYRSFRKKVTKLDRTKIILKKK
ncbi:MAG: hypothetical protein ACJAVA_002273 [Flavobacteriaceae bacterium]|jgi:hypothetical protein